MTKAARERERAREAADRAWRAKWLAADKSYSKAMTAADAAWEAANEAAEANYRATLKRMGVPHG